MHKLFIPALELLESRVRKGFSRSQIVFAALIGVAILANFMFRASCPAERRFFKSRTSQSVAICAPEDLVRRNVPLGNARNANVAAKQLGLRS
jgi:hypothetical protein